MNILEKQIEKHLLLSVFIPLIIIFIIVRFVFQFDGLYGQDAYEYERYASDLAQNGFALDGQNEFFWPVYYPLLGALLKFVFVSSGLALQLLSVISFGLLIYISIKLNEKINGAAHRDSYLWFFVFLLFSPYVFRNGFNCMSDMLAATLVLATIYYSYKYWFNQITKYIALAFSFGVMAFFTRYASAVVLLVPLLIIILRGKYLQIGIAMGIASLFILPWILLKTDPVNSLSHSFLENWSLTHFFDSEFSTPEGVAFNRLPNILYSLENIFHPGYFFFGAVSILILFRNRKQLKYNKEQFIFLLAPVVVYAFFLAGISRQNDRFLILTFPLVLIFLYPAWKFILQTGMLRVPKLSIPLFLLVNIFLTVMAFQHSYNRNQTEKVVAEKILELNGDLLYTFEMDVAMIVRGYKGHIINFYESDIHSFSTGALVLINEKNIESQWKTKRPDKNLKRLNTDYQLELISDYENDWKLYKIKGKK